MKTFEQLRRYIKENIPDPFKTKKGEGPDFEKNLKKATTKTYKQKGLDLYKAGGPYIPDKEVSQKTGKKVTQQIKKPYFGKPTLPQKTNKAPDRKGLKKAISDVRAGEKRLYDAGVGKKPSLVQQRKFTLSKIKQLSRQTTLKDKLYGSTNVGGGGASGSTKNIKPKTVTPTPTKGVKQSEVSKKAKDFTKKINQQRKVTTSGTPMRKGATSVPKDAAKDIQVGKMKNRIKELSAKREKMRSFTGKKDVKGMRTVNKQIKQYQKSIKSNPFVPTVYDPKNAPKKSTPVKQSNVTVNKTRGPYKKVQNTIKGAKGPTSMKDVQLPQFSKTDSPSFKLSSKGQRVASKIPKAFRGKGFAKVGKAILKNPYIATAAAVGIGGYAAYKGIKGLLNKPKAASLKTTDLKPGRTVTYGRDDPKGKFKKGDEVRFDALGLGFTKKTGVEKKKPTYKDFTSGKYTFK